MCQEVFLEQDRKGSCCYGVYIPEEETDDKLVINKCVKLIVPANDKYYEEPVTRYRYLGKLPNISELHLMHL